MLGVEAEACMYRLKVHCEGRQGVLQEKRHIKWDTGGGVVRCLWLCSSLCHYGRGLLSAEKMLCVCVCQRTLFWSLFRSSHRVIVFSGAPSRSLGITCSVIHVPVIVIKVLPCVSHVREI